MVWEDQLGEGGEAAMQALFFTPSELQVMAITHLTESFQYSITSTGMITFQKKLKDFA